MTDYVVKKYSSLHFNEWNNFVMESKNGTFLFHRDFMSYHEDRFNDFSLMIFRKEKLLAILPANRIKDEIFSHKGLSYGGLILLRDIKFEAVLQVFVKLLEFLEVNNIKTLFIKLLPSIYSDLPNDEIKYLLFILKAKLICRNTLSVINLIEKLKVSNNRMEGFKRGKKNDLTVKEEEVFDLFWNSILSKNLKNKYESQPVHSLEQISLLKERFPNNIRQFNVYHKDRIVAGTTIFESKNVAHTQYISGDEDKNLLGSLDFLHLHLINNVFKNKKYFDFGSSNENRSQQINKGLQYWKEGFGARTIIQDSYGISIENYKELMKIMI